MSMWRDFPTETPWPFVPWSGGRFLTSDWQSLMQVSWLGRANLLLAMCFTFFSFYPRLGLCGLFPQTFSIVAFLTFRLAESVGKSSLFSVSRNILQIFVSVVKVIFWFAFCLPLSRFITCKGKRGVLCISSTLDFDFVEPLSFGLISQVDLLLTSWSFLFL